MVTAAVYLITNSRILIVHCTILLCFPHCYKVWRRQRKEKRTNAGERRTSGKVPIHQKYV